ncbi:PorT family protein [Flavobacterium sp. GSP27]|uniref:PorT family protein n=1 Tax=Flavobacterium bomense TaxID=2497483 RepID=A0A432CM37_9FLAO|nr:MULTISPECIES: porin family protein [Flavobacterium]RTY94380.1 PorT family protein [Flavobacterium sp. GSN2]RTY76081.1 PorT family protein [Flavobacterium sp. LS1R10]RTY79615.1 PorT family protein [Flavobacterium sp. LS1P28]RTY82704.1 PorT family protein [Flavobacterium sp. ZB4P23]RTZ00028.1 PorT family protein [Flavobacterium sp. RSP49]
MRIFLSCFLLLMVATVFSQENTPSQDTLIMKVDSLYREDQFYFGITYNILTDGPSGLSQSKFSSGLSGGFLRDMPLNKKRTVAIASGIGFTYNNYNQNIAISATDGMPVYALIDANRDYNKNKFSLLSVDVPVEFRWRTSTYESHKFWRIYTGIKFSYLLYDKSVFDSAQGKVVVTGNKDFNKLQYGAYVSAGYNTINLYAYYGLNSIFKSAKIEDKSITMKALNIGIVFYIL